VSQVALLDVNLLVALFDPDHIHHEVAHDWFEDNRAGGWATCPVTENGFVRVLTNPAYGSAVTRPLDLLVRLRQFCSSGNHAFWADSISIREPGLFDAAMIRGHRQLTDVYLLGLAVQMGGRLATFDRTIPLGSVAGATRTSLAVISPVVVEE
jgi:toxin-antitoxin system PIN domain toxin